VGIRVGNWLSVRQAQSLLNAPDVSTVKGLRDRAILAVLLGCGLRRSEVAALTFEHVQLRDGRWCIVDLRGKHGRVRTAPMPTWVKVAIDAWTSAAGVADGYIFRPVNRADRVAGERLGEKVVWQMLQQYAAVAGVPGIAPHDLRSYAESRIMPNRFEKGAFGVKLAVLGSSIGFGITLRRSEAFQKGEEVIVGPVATRSGLNWVGPGQDLFLYS